MDRSLSFGLAPEGGLRSLELRELRERFVEERARIIGDEHSRAVRAAFAEPICTARDPQGDASLPDRAGAPRRTRRIRLQAIERALQRLAVGQYGACIACHQPIPLARLRAAPTVRCCSRCAAALGRDRRSGPPHTD